MRGAARAARAAVASSDAGAYAAGAGATSFGGGADRPSFSAVAGGDFVTSSYGTWMGPLRPPAWRTSVRPSRAGDGCNVAAPSAAAAADGSSSSAPAATWKVASAAAAAASLALAASCDVDSSASTTSCILVTLPPASSSSISMPSSLSLSPASSSPRSSGSASSSSSSSPSSSSSSSSPRRAARAAARFDSFFACVRTHWVTMPRSFAMPPAFGGPRREQGFTPSISSAASASALPTSRHESGVYLGATDLRGGGGGESAPLSMPLGMCGGCSRVTVRPML